MSFHWNEAMYTRTSFENVNVQPTHKATHEQYLKETKAGTITFSNGSRTEVYACSHTQVKQHQVREQPSCKIGLQFSVLVPCTNLQSPTTMPLQICSEDFCQVFLAGAMPYGVARVEQRQTVERPVNVGAP